MNLLWWKQSKATCTQHTAGQIARHIIVGRCNRLSTYPDFREWLITGKHLMIKAQIVVLAQPWKAVIQGE